MIIKFKGYKVNINDTCGLTIKEVISHATRAISACDAIKDDQFTNYTFERPRQYLNMIVPRNEVAKLVAEAKANKKVD